jgi:hypothetical protein
MPHDEHAAAAPPPPAPEPPEPEREPTWTRRDDKLLELLLVTSSIVAIHYGSDIIGKTLAQMERRSRFMFTELRHVLEALDVETPPEWDMEIAATAAAPAAEEEAPEAAVPSAPPVAVAEDSALPTVVGGGGGTSEGRQVRRKKKKAVKWTPDEHRYAHRLFCLNSFIITKSGLYQTSSRPLSDQNTE